MSADITERPVMTREQLMAIGKRILSMSTMPVVNITVTHTARVVTRLTDNRVLSSDDGDTLSVQIYTSAGLLPYFSFLTNQLDDSVLFAGVQQCEALLRANPTYRLDTGMKHEVFLQDTPMPVHLWHDSTIQAMTSTRGTVLADIVTMARSKQLHAAGFLGFMARAEAVIRKDGNIIFFHEETDSELTVTARDRVGKSVGWSGQAARDWGEVNVAGVTQQAITMAKLGRNPVAVEPGRRTAIFTPSAVVQMLRYLTGQLNARDTDRGSTALSKYPPPRGGNKLRQHVVDPRITIQSDPNDPEGGYRPYIVEDGVATPAMTWIERGVLTNMSYDVYYAMDRGKTYADYPSSFRMSGGVATVEEMIAQCKEGILVNRVTDVELLDEQTCMLTGVTQGGCFLVKNGKISQGVKNFRFVDSPFFFLNNVEALGVPKRAAFGHTSHTPQERFTADEWPRPPIIVPAMMVRDFNFSSIADVV